MVTAFRGVQIPFDRLNIINRCWGRFGLKAGSSTLRQQSASAFSGDIGISTPLFAKGAGDCSQVQIACRKASAWVIRMIVALRLIKRALISLLFSTAIWAYRPAAMQMTLTYFWSKEVFYTTGCTAYHQPSFVTHPPRRSTRAELSIDLAVFGHVAA